MPHDKRLKVTINLKIGLGISMTTKPIPFHYQLTHKRGWNKAEKIPFLS
jgi:hypothetical protein